MLVPLTWLAEYVDLDLSPEELAEALTAAGLKVESIRRPGRQVRGVVVGEVRSIRPHPNASKLVVIEVALEGESRQIVCGAQNFAVGDRVPAALPGARLADGAEIRRQAFRGEISDGMLCSPRELGVSEDHSGILVLSRESRVGADVAEVLGLGDVVLEVEITPNRPDAMSLLGIAREVAAITGTEVRYPQPAIEEGVSAAPVSDLADVLVEDPDACPRYLARVITGVTPGPSPDRMQRRLLAAGFRPISNVVDATNYALLVTGHPMHAFDLDRLEGARVVVRRARPGERLTTLDGTDRALDPDDLMIADAAFPVALAGVIGGADTQVSETTRRVLLESAYFDPASVFRTSKRQALRTEASARFERGADPGNVPYSAELACSFIQA
ncbi:MAG: phenylalanine--tRNA ligase subunit beta, partial [Actinomycetota bacterium]